MKTLSISILNQLENNFPEIMFAIIGDSPFESCCTDYMSAKHINAEAILHFGHTCNNESDLPMLHFDEALSPLYEAIEERQASMGTKIFVTGPVNGHTKVTKEKLREFNKEITEVKSEADSIVYVGSGCCVSSLIENPRQNIWILSSSGLEKHDSYQFISKRFHFISQVSNSKVFGIIISSLAVYNKIGASLKSLLSKFDKVFYPIYLGKITPLKLGNFKEIDMFILVSCKNTELPDNKIFYKPIITPYELEVGLNGGWDGNYSTDFSYFDEKNSVKIYSETSERFSHREFKGLIPDVLGNFEVEDGYDGIATKYKSEAS